MPIRMLLPSLPSTHSYTALNRSHGMTTRRWVSQPDESVGHPGGGCVIRVTMGGIVLTPPTIQAGLITRGRTIS